MMVRFVAALIVIPLIYLSFVRLISQFVVPTDTSSLWESPGESSSPASLTTLKALKWLDPLNPEYPYLAAERLSGVDPDKALRLNERAVSLSVLNPRYRIQEGWLTAQKGNLAGAFGSFEKAIFLDPRDVNVYLQQGLFLFQAMPYVEQKRKAFFLSMAEQNFSLVSQYAPSLLRSPRVAFALASIYSERGEKERARMLLRRAYDAPASDPVFLVRMWALHFQLGETKRPISQWEALLQGEKPSTGQLAIIAVEMAKYDIPDFSYFTARIHIMKGETELALRELTSLVSQRPYVAEYRLALGDLCEKLGKHADALSQYEKAVELSPTNQYARSKMIEYYKRRN